MERHGNSSGVKGRIGAIRIHLTGASSECNLGDYRLRCKYRLVRSGWLDLFLCLAWGGKTTSVIPVPKGSLREML